MSRFFPVILTAVAALTARTGGAADSPVSRPNVLVILTDDQGWGDLSVHGNGNLETPLVDQLCRDGATFDRFFVCPVCSPTRAEFLTGRYFPRGGVRGVSTGQERLDPDEQTIGDVFQESGYRTGAFGKWHNGTQFPYHPNARGFDEYYGFCSGHWGNYWNPILDHNGEIVDGKGFIIDDLTDHAIEFIRDAGEQPFFCYVPYNTPHSPMQVPDRWWDRHKSGDVRQRHRDPDKENLRHTRAALAMCENIDWNVGRLLKTLEEQQVVDDTIVIYFCDNGPNGYRWNGGMKGRKGSVDEGGVRSPLFIRWPGRIEAGHTVNQIAGAIDLLPTLTDLVGIQRSGDKPLDGKSLKPLLTGEHPDWPDRMITSHWRNRVSVRSQQFRLDNSGQLFDMVQDPGQHTNVADQHPQVTKQMLAAAKDYRRTVLAEYADEFDPFPVGHRSGTVTQLPIRDATSSGNIQRSARPPNSSYFKNWISPEDRILWSVKVEESATYEAELLYTCDEKNAGTVIRLEAIVDGRTTMVETKATAHESGPIEVDRDRDPRKEGYEKDWGRLKLGQIHLTAGTGEIRLTAPEIVGDKAIDVRLLLLRRRD